MLLYVITLFTSAFLLFEVQPLIAKIILPWFGGSASVWTTCMLFFQCVLLLGYVYAHWIIRHLTPRKQVMLHMSLLATSVMFLPVAPGARWISAESEEPVFKILVMLLFSIGLPYFLLATSSPMFQAWFSGAKPSSSPYRLFALSNLGSLLALLSYPVLVEPFSTTRTQSRVWSLAYLIFVGLCTMLALRHGWFMSRDAISPRAENETKEIQPPSWSLRFLWLALAACASILFLAVTNYLSQDVAAIPFLWILPLSLYLLSFILCFESDRWYRRNLFLRAAAVTLAGMAFLLLRDNQVNALQWVIPTFSVGLFLCCMVCHGELAKLRPPAFYLTGFYLRVAWGGAVGGVFVGLIAPHAFRDFYELPIGLTGFVLLVLLVLLREIRFSILLAARDTRLLLLLAVGVFVVQSFALKAWALASEARVMGRNFYGMLRVVDHADEKDGPGVRKLINGRITHGEQYLNPSLRRRPLTYYTRHSGVGLALLRPDRPPTERVGIIGLGAGTMATYGRPGDVYRFYEINPRVIEEAQSEFTYLRDCEARVEMVLGDARLSLEREPSQQFDVLVVDAFTSDSIPVHLLTREAFELYFRHLKPQGILLVHVSNQYFDLTPVVESAAKAVGKTAWVLQHSGEPEHHVSSTTWVWVGLPRNSIEQSISENLEQQSKPRRLRRPWTDDYSNLLLSLK